MAGLHLTVDADSEEYPHETHKGSAVTLRCLGAEVMLKHAIHSGALEQFPVIC